MIDPRRFVTKARELGIDLFTGVPDSLLAPLCAHLFASLPDDQHIIAANEGAAVGLAIGHHLATGKPALVYMQNSGIGNAINPLLSLADPDVYGVPMVLLVGWRGRPGEKDEPQHVKQGKVMEPLLDALDLPWALLPHDGAAEAESCLAHAVETAMERRSPFVLLVAKGSFEKLGTKGAAATDETELPTREDALIALMEALGPRTVNVSTTGMLSRELFEFRARRFEAARDFLTVGGMGHCVSIALGVALDTRDREVWCLDGDGALLMHMGSLAVIADRKPENFFHVVFNNGVHDSVGGQPTSISAMDPPALARAAGYRFAATTSAIETIPSEVAKMRSAGGPAFLELRVRPGNRPDIGRPTKSPKENKRAFMDELETTEG